MADRGDRIASASRDELRTCRKRIEDLTGQMNGLSSQVGG